MKDEFTQVYEKFAKQKHKIPTDMSFKLQFMCDYMRDKLIVDKLTQEEQQTIKDILDLEDKAIEVLFVSIVKSILSPMMYSSFQKNCKIKIPGYLSRWTNAYITFQDHQSIIFNTFKKKLRFVLRNLQVKVANGSNNQTNNFFNIDSADVPPEQMNNSVVSKSAIKKKKKENRVKLYFYYKGQKKLQIKFDRKQAANSMIANINQMQEHLEQIPFPMRNSSSISQNQKFTQYLQKQYTVQYKSKQLLYKVHKTDPKIFLQIFMQGHFWNIFHLFQFFITHKNWNSKIKAEKIRKYGDKSYIIERKSKSNTLMAPQRRTVTKFTLTKTSQNQYIGEQQSAVEFSTFQQKKTISQLFIVYGFQILAPKIIKVNIEASFDGKKLFKNSDSRAFLVQYFSDIVFVNSKYSRMKQKSKLNFDLELQKIVEMGEPNKNTHFFKHSEGQKQQMGQNHKEEEQKFYSVQKNKRQSLINQGYIMQNQARFCQIKEEQQDEDQFFDIPDADWDQYEDEDDEDDDSALGPDQAPEKLFQKQQNDNVQSIQENQQKQEKYKQGISSVEQIHEVMTNLMPKQYKSEIKIEYLKNLRAKIYQKYYLKSHFPQKEREIFKDEPPYYDLSIVLPHGKQFKESENNELFFVNQEVIDGQKDSLKWVIKQIGANLISGKSVLNVSLPVDIFQSKSLLERIAGSFGCAPKYLKSVAEADCITQIKAVFSFSASVLPLDILMLKPFNPILGETFQGFVGGVPIFIEQISHHPPISSYYMKCDQFTLYGNLNAVANVSLNSANGGNSGKMHIIMKNGNQFDVTFCPVQIGGLIFGQRKIGPTNKCFVINKKNQLVTQISVGKDVKGVYEKKKDEKLTKGDIIGGIFKVTQKFINHISAEKSLMYYGGLKKGDVEEKISDIRGLWFKDIYIDDQQVNKDKKAYPVEYFENWLPSDSNFRLDIMMHRVGDLARSQTEKEVLENLQRYDRKLRQKLGNKK